MPLVEVRVGGHTLVITFESKKKERKTLVQTSIMITFILTPKIAEFKFKYFKKIFKIFKFF